MISFHLIHDVSFLFFSTFTQFLDLYFVSRDIHNITHTVAFYVFAVKFIIVLSAFSHPHSVLFFSSSFRFTAVENK